MVVDPYRSIVLWRPYHCRARITIFSKKKRAMNVLDIIKKGGILTVLFMAPLFVFGQQLTRKGYDQLQDTSGVVISQHTRIEKGLEEALKKEPGTYTYQPAPIEIVIEEHFCSIDTIYIGDDWTGLQNMQVIDTISGVFRNYSSIRSPKRAVLTDCCNVIVAEKDSSLTVPKYNFTAKLLRTKSWPKAETTYRLIENDFYFHESDSVALRDEENGIFRYRTFGNKKHCIKHIINGEDLGIVACSPGNSEYAGGSYRHSNTMMIDFSIENIVELVAYSLDSTRVMGSRQIVIPKK